MVHMVQKNKPGKLPTKWTVVFDQDNIYDFDPNTFEIGSNIPEENMKDDMTITSNIDNEKMNTRVIFS